MIQTVPYIGQPATLPLVSIETEKQIRTRNGFDETSLRELAATIREVGIIEPIIVRRHPTQDDRYIVIAGERRLLAASLADLAEVPTIIRETTPEAAAVVQAIENLQRVDLSLADTAEGVALLVKEHRGVKAVAKLLGKSPAWVSKHASIAKLTTGVRRILDNELSEDPELLLALDQIARMKTEDAIEAFVKLANGLESGTTTRASVRAALERLKAGPVSPSSPGEGEGDDDGEQANDQAPTEKFGRLELAEAAAQKMLAALKYAQEHKPSSRPGDHLIAYVEDFIRKTWGA
jgi:ParB/RepB/Spo0J family partition protein